MFLLYNKLLILTRIKKIYVYFSILIFFLFLWYFILQQFQKNDLKTICYQKVSTIVQWSSMVPILKNWQDIQVLEHYYDCNEVKRWDIVIYQSAGRWQLVKQVRALPWDMIYVDFEKWNLQINWEYLKSDKGQDYNFTQWELDFMNLYIQNGYLKEWNYFVFGTDISWWFDSRRFAWVSRDKFIAKVILE